MNKRRHTGLLAAFLLDFESFYHHIQHDRHSTVLMSKMLGDKQNDWTSVRVFVCVDGVSILLDDWRTIPTREVEVKNKGVDRDSSVVIFSPVLSRLYLAIQV